jgi:uncharacterized protein (DUF1330 family)
MIALHRPTREDDMAAYVIAQIDITDPEAFEAYRAKVPATIEKHGGRYKVRGGAVTPLEGTPPNPRIVVLEFDSVEAARRWYDSDDYRPLIPMRQAAAKGPVMIVEGA